MTGSCLLRQLCNIHDGSVIHYGAEAILKCMIFMPQPPKCCDYRCALMIEWIFLSRRWNYILFYLFDHEISLYHHMFIKENIYYIWFVYISIALWRRGALVPYTAHVWTWWITCRIFSFRSNILVQGFELRLESKHFYPLSHPVASNFKTRVNTFLQCIGDNSILYGS